MISLNKVRTISGDRSKVDYSSFREENKHIIKEKIEKSHMLDKEEFLWILRK